MLRRSKERLATADTGMSRFKLQPDPSPPRPARAPTPTRQWMLSCSPTGEAGRLRPASTRDSEWTPPPAPGRCRTPGRGRRASASAARWRGFERRALHPSREAARAQVGEGRLGVDSDEVDAGPADSEEPLLHCAAARRSLASRQVQPSSGTPKGVGPSQVPPRARRPGGQVCAGLVSFASGSAAPRS